MKQGLDSNHLGELIYQARKAKGLETREVAEQIGVHKATIHRIQIGEIQQPSQEVLAGLAKVLGLKLAELYALAGYGIEDELPDFRGWINLKHRELPDEAVESLEDYLDFLVTKHSQDASDETKQRKEEP